MNRSPSFIVGRIGRVRREEARLKGIFALALQLSLGASLAACAKETGRQDHGPKDAAAKPAQAEAASPCSPKLLGVVFAMLDAGAECRASQRLSCGLPPEIRPVDGGCSFSVADCQHLCPSYGAYNCQASDASCTHGSFSGTGSLVVTCDFCPGGIGRRPRGLVAPGRDEAVSPLGDHFARAAYLEAASVGAFRKLRVALAFHRAPRELLDSASDAASDEIRHARAAGRLARRFGGRRSRVPVSRNTAVPSLEALAVENAVEGCVRETYGALFASFQAARASDREVATAMTVIARDETRHAALSWAIMKWALPRLSAEGRRRVENAMETAVSGLLAEIGSAPPALVEVAGVPGIGDQRRLLAELRASLFDRCLA